MVRANNSKIVSTSTNKINKMIKNLSKFEKLKFSIKIIKFRYMKYLTKLSIPNQFIILVSIKLPYYLPMLIANL